jgi:hypothetical protein
MYQALTAGGRKIETWVAGGIVRTCAPGGVGASPRYLFCAAADRQDHHRKILSRAINCAHPLPRRSCGEWTTASHPGRARDDVVEIDRRLQQRVDEIRDLAKRSSTPVGGRYRCTS